MKADMEILIGNNVQSTAEWRRRKAAEHPGDTRNAEAAVLLDAIALQVDELDGSDLHRRLSAWNDTSGHMLSEVVSEKLRQVGFSIWPSTATELVEGILLFCPTEEQRESRVRRDLRRLGLRLNKAPARHWTRKEYGVGYMILEGRNWVIEGCGQREYEMTLADVEDYLDRVAGPAGTRLLRVPAHVAGGAA